MVYFGGAWVLGRALRRRRLATVELRDRAARLEREREERARAAVAEERGRIARELHDVIAHSMSVIVVQAGAAEQILEHDPARAREALRSIRRAGTDALEEMRRLLGILRHEDEELTLAPQPSIARLNELLGQARAGGLPVELVVDGQPRQLAPGVELAAYRIVQEALTNSRKHAGTAHAKVIVRYAPDALELDVVDDGRAARKGEGTGHGLVGMRERAALYGGVLEAGARPEGGFAVHARLPLDPPGRDLGRHRRRPGPGPRWLPHDSGGPARHRGRRRGRRRLPGGRPGPPAPAGRRADGHPHAGPRRDRGDPAAAR